MLKISSEISEPRSEMSPEVAEVRGYFCDAVSAEFGDARARVIHEIHRATGLTEGRIARIMRNEVRRLWCDEYRSIRDWHQSWCDRQVAQLRHKAEMLEARTQARRSA